MYEPTAPESFRPENVDKPEAGVTVLVPESTAPLPVEAATVTSLVALVTRLPDTSRTAITGCEVNATRLTAPDAAVSTPRW